MEDVPSYVKAPAAGRVKNKAPAKIQITAEQLLREAWERKESGPPALPKLQITDKHELLEYQREERKTFETRIVRNREHTPLWIRYAKWEEDQGEITRARSVWERAIDNDYRNQMIWQAYAEMEMRGGFINHARNVFDRAVGLLPRVDNLWTKYAHMEEVLGQIDLSRLVYHRWLKWLPAENAYLSLIRFELRHGSRQAAREAYAMLVEAHPSAYTFAKMAKFEERFGEFAHARAVYERGAEVLVARELTAAYFIGFARFEERRKEVERTRVIYQFALKQLEGNEKAEVERAFVKFEKGTGDRDMLDQVVVERGRQKLLQQVEQDEYNYDAWFDLIALEERSSEKERVEKCYEMALSKRPLAETKNGWRKYVYLWISYATWMELNCGDTKKATSIYRRCIKAIPGGHKKFSFGKVWVLYAQALIRDGNISSARQVFGSAIGVLKQKESVYRAYVELEKGLGEIGRVRRVYEKWLENVPKNGEIFLEYAELERALDEPERAWGVLELGRSIEGVSHSEEIWDMSIDVGREVGKASDELFERYVRIVSKAKAWIVWAKEVEERGGKIWEVRKVYERGEGTLRGGVMQGMVEIEEVKVLVSQWLEWEEETGGETEEVEKLMPRKTKKRRRIDGKWEDVWEDSLVQIGGSGGKSKLLQAAKKWKTKV